MMNTAGNPQTTRFEPRAEPGCSLSTGPSASTPDPESHGDPDKRHFVRPISLLTLPSSVRDDEVTVTAKSVNRWRDRYTRRGREIGVVAVPTP